MTKSKKTKLSLKKKSLRGLSTGELDQVRGGYYVNNNLAGDTIALDPSPPPPPPGSVIYLTEAGTCRCATNTCRCYTKVAGG